MNAAGWYWALLPTVWLAAMWVCLIAVHADRARHQTPAVVRVHHDDESREDT